MRLFLVKWGQVHTCSVPTSLSPAVVLLWPGRHILETQGLQRIRTLLIINRPPHFSDEKTEVQREEVAWR